MKYAEMSLLLGLVLCAPMALADDWISAEVNVETENRIGSIEPDMLGVGLHIGTKQMIGNPESAEQVVQMGFKMIRFPNGCQADEYNWLAAQDKGQVTVDDFPEFCEKTNTTPYYTLNMQGGTDGLDHPIPENASLDERIRYKHHAPNPCGYTAERYHYGTLDEAVQLVSKYTVERFLNGDQPIQHYELGNENWGQCSSDWQPEVYCRTAEVYASAIRSVVNEEAREHPELHSVKLRITAVGYPIMGNNQDPEQATNHKINVAWTEGLNDLYRRGIIDAVQEHFYPHSTGTGDALVWTEHNLNNIMLTRRGIPNPRLNGYFDSDLDYEMPIDYTEWNLKCWGPAPQFHPVANADFEEGLANWITEASPERGARLLVTPRARRRGEKGLEIRTGWRTAVAEASITFMPDGKQPDLYMGGWVRTNKPDAVSLILRNAGQVIQERKALSKDRWQRYLVGADLPEATSEAEFVIRVHGSRVKVWFDNLEAITYASKASRAPVSVNTFEQQLYGVDAIRKMIEHGTALTHFHHLFGNYGCPTLKVDCTPRDNANIFKFYSGRIGTHRLKSETHVGTFDYASHAASWATDFNALAPNTTSIPCLSALATRDDNELHLLLINRSTDRNVRTRIRLSEKPSSETASVRRITSEDYNASGAVLSEHERSVSKTFTHIVPPHTADMITIAME